MQHARASVIAEKLKHSRLNLKPSIGITLFHLRKKTITILSVVKYYTIQ